MFDSSSVRSWIILALPGLLCCAVPGSVPAREVVMQTPSTQAAELKMQVEVIGEGSPLVLIGGGLTGWRSWEPHAERLSGTRRVARLQLLSVEYGLEDRPLPAGYSAKLESRALAAALDGLGWTEPLDLVAWSYGALITLDFALDHPERVRTLTLIEPPAIWVLTDQERADSEVRALDSLLRTFTGEISESDLEQWARAVGLVPPGTAARELPQWPLWVQHRRSLRNGPAPFDHRDDPARLRAFERPVLLVTGSGTAPFLRRIHDALAAWLPRAPTAEMPAGHAPQLVSMDRFLAEMARFQADGD